jgi:hypothetical protein
MANKNTPKKSTSKKAEHKYLPTQVAVAKSSKGKLVLVVGARRIAALPKGAIIDTGKRFWSQMKYTVIATAKDGKARLSSRREAQAKGWAVQE